jgi:hypothetical protein
MSVAKAPYYYKEGNPSDAYHWETSCSKNYYPASGWKKANSKEDLPSNKQDQCTECQSK